MPHYVAVSPNDRAPQLFAADGDEAAILKAQRDLGCLAVWRADPLTRGVALIAVSTEAQFRERRGHVPEISDEHIDAIQATQPPPPHKETN